MARDNVVLIGYRGTGKSEVGRILARRIGYSFVDTDALVEQRSGRSIAQIFEEGGERRFRELETAAVLEAAERFGCVIATGGGVVVREGNMDALKMHGKVVWLMAAPETIHRRISRDASSPSRRPNLTELGGLEEIRRVLSSRMKLYQQHAVVKLKTDGRTPRQVADDIQRALRLKATRPASSGLSFPVIPGDDPPPGLSDHPPASPPEAPTEGPRRGPTESA